MDWKKWRDTAKDRLNGLVDKAKGDREEEIWTEATDSVPAVNEASAAPSEGNTGVAPPVAPLTQPAEGAAITGQQPVVDGGQQSAALGASVSRLTDSPIQQPKAGASRPIEANPEKLLKDYKKASKQVAKLAGESLDSEDIKGFKTLPPDQQKASLAEKLNLLDEQYAEKGLSPEEISQKHEKLFSNDGIVSQFKDMGGINQATAVGGAAMAIHGGVGVVKGFKKDPETGKRNMGKVAIRALETAVGATVTVAAFMAGKENYSHIGQLMGGRNTPSPAGQGRA